MAELDAAPNDMIPNEPVSIEPAPIAAQDNSPPAEVDAEPAEIAVPAPAPAQADAPVAAPLFRARQDLPKGDIPKAAPSSIPAVIPILRAPDDPGVDDEGGRDEFAEQIGQPQRQAGGWRGFLSRWGG